MGTVLEVSGNEIWVEVAGADGAPKLYAIDLRGADAATKAADTAVRFARADRSRTMYLRAGKDDAAIEGVLAVAATEVAAYVDAFLAIQPNGGEDERFYA